MWLGLKNTELHVRYLEKRSRWALETTVDRCSEGAFTHSPFCKFGIFLIRAAE